MARDSCSYFCLLMSSCSARERALGSYVVPQAHLAIEVFSRRIYVAPRVMVRHIR